MKTLNVVTKLSYSIIILALITAGTGLLWKMPGNNYDYKAITGEVSRIYGGEGLYRNNTLSLAAQAIGQDFVTIFVGIPLLFISLLLARKGSLRGQLLLIGSLGYMLYTFTSYSFGLAYNEMFLVYVALFTLVLFALVLALSGMDVESVTQKMSNSMPRRGTALYLAFISVYLTLAWFERIFPALIKGRPPFGLEANTTLAIQVLDLGFVAPICMTAAILLWQRRAWGCILAAALLIKALTMGIALIAMVIMEFLSGVKLDLFGVIIAFAMAPVALVFTVLLFRNIDNKSKVFPKEN